MIPMRQDERTRIVVRSLNERRRTRRAARSTLAVIFGVLLTAAIGTAIFDRLGLELYSGFCLCAALAVALILAK